MIYDFRLMICPLPDVCPIVNRQSSIVNAILAMAPRFRYLVLVNRLTKQEQLVLCIVLGLLLTGWAVKTYRAAHPAAAATQVAAP
jgi:hypothetical protein